MSSTKKRAEHERWECNFRAQKYSVQPGYLEISLSLEETSDIILISMSPASPDHLDYIQ